MSVQKLTKSLIDAAAPKAHSYELRDTEVKGFLCKVSPTGTKVYHVAYRTITRKRRKMKIGEVGIYKVAEAREVARRWLQEVREDGDPAAARQLAREELTVADLCDRFIRDHSELYNKPSTTSGYRQQIAQRVLPALGAKKIGGVSRADIVTLMRENAYAPTQANRTLALVKKMFNCAEVWGLRDESTNPCRLVKMYKTKPKTRLLTDHEVKAILKRWTASSMSGSFNPSTRWSVGCNLPLPRVSMKFCLSNGRGSTSSAD